MEDISAVSSCVESSSCFSFLQKHEPHLAASVHDELCWARVSLRNNAAHAWCAVVTAACLIHCSSASNTIREIKLFLPDL